VQTHWPALELDTPPSCGGNGPETQEAAAAPGSTAKAGKTPTLRRGGYAELHLKQKAKDGYLAVASQLRLNELLESSLPPVPAFTTRWATLRAGEVQAQSTKRMQHLSGRSRSRSPAATLRAANVPDRKGRVAAELQRLQQVRTQGFMSKSAGGT
jgi:hypothetical protein